MEAWRWYRRSLAATCGAPIPSEARQRLLLVIAEGAATEGRVRTAEKLLETALREGAGRAGDTELDRRIRAELERWRGKRGN
jgi:hypothetical protein